MKRSRYHIVKTDGEFDYFELRKNSPIEKCVVHFKKKEPKDPLEVNQVQEQSLYDFLVSLGGRPDLSMPFLCRHDFKILEKLPKGEIDISARDTMVIDGTWKTKKMLSRGFRTTRTK